MDFGWSEAERTFRAEVRAFIAVHWRGRGGPGHELLHAYERELADRGWLALSWPERYGGRGASRMEQLIFAEESALAGAPDGGPGIAAIGPMLMLHGTEAQRREYLPRIARAQGFWCMGFSEPGTGSDLASLQTRAVRDGDEYVLNGQKIWTSAAHSAQWMLVLARTSAGAPGRRGISAFILPMDAPGITVRSVRQLHGGRGFNEVFLEDVRVPAAAMVGAEHHGWPVAMATLDFGRSGIDRVAGVASSLAELLALTWPRGEGHRREDDQREGAAGQHTVRACLADTAIELEVARTLAYRVTGLQARGAASRAEASMSKLFGSELQQRHARRALNALGLHGALDRGSPHAPLGGAACRSYMATLEHTIAGGTSEVQRHIIASRGLGLPRG